MFLAALALRLAPFPAATSRGWRLLSPDCYGHLRRTVSVARNFPRVPYRDPYLNHPDGGVFIWPPAFDLVAGGAARILFGRGATTEQVLRVAATLPALLGALQILPLFAVARRAFGRRRARIATAAYVALPAAVLWGGFGHFDHHVAEALNLLLVLAAGAWAAAARGDARFARAVAFGAAIALAVLTWQGAVFVAGLSFLWAALALGEAAAVAGLVATALVALGAARDASGGARALLVRLLRLVPAPAPRGRAPCRFSRWRSGARPRPGGALCGGFSRLSASPSRCPTRGASLESVFHGGAYVFKGGAGARADDFADGGFLSYPPEFLRLVAECQPLVRGWSSFERAVREVSPASSSCRSRRSCGSGRRSGGRSRPRAAARLLARLLRGGRVRDGPLPAAQRLLPRDLRRARARRARRADRAAPDPAGARGPPFRSLSPRASSSCPGASVPRAGARLRGRPRVRRPRPLRAAPRARSASGGPVGRAAAGPGRDPGRHAALVRRPLRDGDRGAAVRRRSVRLRLAPAVPAVHGDG